MHTAGHLRFPNPKIPHFPSCPGPSLTFALVLLLLLLAELVQGQLVEVQAVQVARQHLGERLHGEGPLGDQLLPAGERGEHGQQVVPQLPRDVHVQVSFDPRHNQSLRTDLKTGVTCMFYKLTSRLQR